MRRNEIWNGLLAGLAAVVLQTTCFADDWPQWGGPQRDCVWHEDGIVDEFPTKDLLPRVWSTPVGEGYSGPAVANGRVFLTDRIVEGNLSDCSASTRKPVSNFGSMSTSVAIP